MSLLHLFNYHLVKQLPFIDIRNCLDVSFVLEVQYVLFGNIFSYLKHEKVQVSHVIVASMDGLWMQYRKNPYLLEGLCQLILLEKIIFRLLIENGMEVQQLLYKFCSCTSVIEYSRVSLC